MFWSILDRGEVITLDRADNRTGLQTSAEMGCRLPVHCTSQGKLFLAFMPEQDQKNILKRTDLREYTPHTITTLPALQKEFEKIRQQGYAIENGEYKMGLRSVAAPIFDHDGCLRYAIGIIGMFRQIESEKFHRAVSVVKETADRISQAL